MPQLTAIPFGELHDHVGEELGLSDWQDVTQEHVNAFADVTGDHQFIHVDPERAKQTPFGGTIAHGFYTLSLAPALAYEMFTVDGASMGLNYGLNRVRFPAPLKVGSRVRMRLVLQDVEDIPGGVQLTLRYEFEAEDSEKPVCVAEALSRVYGAAD